MASVDRPDLICAHCGSTFVSVRGRANHECTCLHRANQRMEDEDQISDFMVHTNDDSVSVLVAGDSTHPALTDTTTHLLPGSNPMGRQGITFGNCLHEASCLDGGYSGDHEWEEEEEGAGEARTLTYAARPSYRGGNREIQMQLSDNPSAFDLIPSNSDYSSPSSDACGSSDGYPPDVWSSDGGGSVDGSLLENVDGDSENVGGDSQIQHGDSCIRRQRVWIVTGPCCCNTNGTYATTYRASNQSNSLLKKRSLPNCWPFYRSQTHH